MSRAVDHTPHRVRVTAQRPPQDGRLCRGNESKSSREDVNTEHDEGVCWEEPGRTIRVVGVDVGVGSVPALNGAVYAPAETLLAARAHGDAQHGSATGRNQNDRHLRWFYDRMNGVGLKVGGAGNAPTLTCGLGMCRWAPRPTPRT